MQKWTSLLALALIVGCAAAPSEPGTFALEPTSEARQVQQVFATPTPTPVATLNPLEASKSNKLIDLTVAQLNASVKEVRTRLTKERDRNLQVFAIPDAYTGRAASATALRYYGNGIESSLNAMDNNFTSLMADLTAVRNRDLTTVRKAIILAKTDWYRARQTAERQALFYRTSLSTHYKHVQAARRKEMR